MSGLSEHELNLACATDTNTSVPVEISHRTSLSLIRWVVSILVTILPTVRYRYTHYLPFYTFFILYILA